MRILELILYEANRQEQIKESNVSKKYTLCKRRLFTENIRIPLNTYYIKCTKCHENIPYDIVVSHCMNCKICYQDPEWCKDHECVLYCAKPDIVYKNVDQLQNNAIE